MDYKEFKKRMMPELDKKMASLGFIREKTSTPTYWKYPNEDNRLAWVVCLNFSHRGNPLFDVLVTPYWTPCQHKDDPFPRSVGYMGHLSPEGFTHGQHTWWTTTDEDAEQSIEELMHALSGPGIEWFMQYSTPQELLEKNPSAKLASDLGDYKLANDLYREKLKSSFVNLLLEKKTNHSSPLESVRGWEIERHERIIEDYKVVLVNLGFAVEEFLNELSTVELEALQEEEEKYSKELVDDPRSRWLKSQIKYCIGRIDELKNKLSIE